MLVVGILVVMALTGLTAPITVRSSKKPDQTEAINNARQIGLALLEFETEYGTYPDDKTASVVLENTKTTLNLTDHSANSFFRQLIAADMAQAETIWGTAPPTIIPPLPKL